MATNSKTEKLANRITKVAQEAGLWLSDFDVARTGSMYADLKINGEEYVVRVADHPAPIGGGFRVSDDILGGERAGNADVDFRSGKEGNLSARDILHRLNMAPQIRKANEEEERKAREEERKEREIRRQEQAHLEKSYELQATGGRTGEELKKLRQEVADKLASVRDPKTGHALPGKSITFKQHQSRLKWIDKALERENDETSL